MPLLRVFIPHLVRVLLLTLIFFLSSSTAYSQNSPPVIQSSDPPAGYIDPLQDRDEITGELRGITDVSITFSEIVTATGGVPLSPLSFQIRYLKDGVDATDAQTRQVPIVDLISGGGAGPYLLRFTPRIPLGALTEITAVDVVDTSGTRITSPGNQIVIGFLPLDITQDGFLLTDDIIRWQQINNNLYNPAPLTDVMLLDQQRNDVVDGADITRAIQLVHGIGSSQEWTDFSIGSANIGSPGDDLILPSIVITSQHNGDILSGEVMVAAHATDNTAISRLQLFVDGSPMATANAVDDAILGVATFLFTSPIAETHQTVDVQAKIFSYKFKNGETHVLSGVVVDRAGNMSTSQPIFVTMNNQQDTTNPTGYLFYPEEGKTYPYIHEVRTQHGEGTGVQKVVYSIDGASFETLNYMPKYLPRGVGYTLWGGSLLPALWNNGPHTLTVTTYDNWGNSSSKSVNFRYGQAGDTGPIVTFASPNNGSIVSGVQNITVNAPTSTQEVHYWVNGELRQAAVTSPFSFSWNTTTLFDGNYTIAVRGNSATTMGPQAQISVQVHNNNPQPPRTDFTPPVVQLLSPMNGATVAGSIIIRVQATDNIQVASVSAEFEDQVATNLLDQATLTGNSRNLYSFLWHSALAAAQQRLYIHAKDGAGNVTTVGPISITVDNAP